MTASAERRKRSTRFGAVAGLLAIVAVFVAAVVAYSTLRSSEEGRAPEVDTRDSVSFPSTPNAVLGVVDDLDRLTSIAVMTLHPSGAGGSIVTIPLNADRTNSFGPERLPISRQPYSPGDEEQQVQLLSELEPLLTLTIERASVVGPDELTELLEAVGPVTVELPERVIDSDTAGSGLVVAEGRQRLDTTEVVEAFTAINAEDASYSHHDVDVALWRAIADAAGDSSVDVPLDEFDRPVPPVGLEQFWARLLGGDVAVRDIAIDVNAAREADNETDADFVLVDRRDALLVFGSVSPGLVSQPNESLTFSLVVAYGESEVGQLGDDAAGNAITKASMTRRFIGEMLFKQANIVAVNLTDAPGSVPEVTRIEVVDERLAADVRAVSERFFGDAEIVVAQTLTDGVDAVVILGSDFLVQRADLLELEREQAAAAAESPDDEPDDADFDVSDGSVTDEPDGDDEDPGSSDTVPVDD